MSRAPRTQPVFTPPGGPPSSPRPAPEILATIGEAGIFRMLADLYEELATSDVAGLFPADMQAASERSAAFFVQLLGGRPLFSMTYGPPQMRARHIPFEIDMAARQTWLDCFAVVLKSAEERYGFPPEHLAGFRAFLESFSSWMVNVAPPHPD